MALSAKMLALLQKIEAADAKHFAGLRESARKDAVAAKNRKAVSRQAAAARARKARPLTSHMNLKRSPTRAPEPAGA
jgi:hypothetical protein